MPDEVLVFEKRERKEKKTVPRPRCTRIFRVSTLLSKLLPTQLLTHPDEGLEVLMGGRLTIN